MITGGATEQQLVELLQTPRDRIPGEARHAAVRTIVNSWALSVGASRHQAVLSARRPLQFARGSATVLGSGQSLPACCAAFANGMAAHVEDFDDTHLRTVVHPGCVVVPAATAAAQLAGCDGATLVDGLVVGVETALRVAVGLGSGHFDRGWHLTSSVGRLGAAAAACRILGLPRPACESALSLAAAEVAGFQEALGTMTKSFHAGKAASDGLEAALLTRAGLVVEPRWVDPLLTGTAPAADIGAITAGLGERWEICQNAIKPYACGIVSHPVIDAGIALASPDAAGVRRVEVTVNPVVLDVMGVEDPEDGLQSKFSVYHCFAVGYLFGAGGLREFSDEVATDGQVAALRSLVVVDTDPSLARDQCRATVIDADGSRRDHSVEHAVGSAARQMSDEELTAKCVTVAEAVLGASGARRLVQAAFALDGAAPLADTLQHADPRPGPAALNQDR